MPKKSLGQHFLKCNWVISTLIKSAQLKPTDIVVEIGPGGGILTRELVKHSKFVLAVEKDENLASLLENTLKKEAIFNVEIIKGDILKTFPDVYQTKFGTETYKVVANIPYYLTSRLLRVFLEKGPQPSMIVLTIQKEVAKRIVAQPPKMNLLALSVQSFGKPQIIKNVPASCFWPKPKVDSAIIKITDISNDFFLKNAINDADFFKLTRMAFSQKRKMLVNSLAKSQPKKFTEQVLTRGVLSPKTRPEELTLAQWTKIYSVIHNLNRT